MFNSKRLSLSVGVALGIMLTPWVLSAMMIVGLTFWLITALVFGPTIGPILWSLGIFLFTFVSLVLGVYVSKKLRI